MKKTRLKPMSLQRVAFILITAVFSLFSVPQQSLALSPAQRHAFDLNVYYFNTSEDSFCDVQVSANLIGSDNAEKAFRYFVQKGLSPMQSAAIVGNFMQESHVNPNSVQSDGPGRGIAQWGVGGRWDTLLKYAQNRNTPPTDLGIQLDFSWHELTTSFQNVLDGLKSAQTIDQATEIISSQYEAAGDPQLSRRIAYAKTILASYGGSSNVAGATPATPTLSDTGTGCGYGPGENTRYVDGFVVYSQLDKNWKNNPYGTSTIGVSGCGPSAMAMIITALTGQTVTPAATTEYANTKNLYVEGQGSSWSIAPVLAEHWGLKAKAIGADVGKITAALQSGALVIGSGQGPEPFTSSGHYIVIRGVTADGKWKIGDSFHPNTSEQDWDPQQLIANMRDGSVYAITK